jgi:hypothetical protein
MNLAYLGACIGAVLVIGHEVYIIYLYRLPDTDQFIHFMDDVMEAGILGALLFAAVASINNWLAEHSW